jgi:hypothetical protein
MMKRLLDVHFRLGLAPWVQAMTMDQLITAVRRNTRDTSSTTTLQRHSDSEILDLLNEGQREFGAETFAIERSTAIATQAGIAVYSLPSNFLAAAQVYHLISTTTVDLELVTRNSLYEEDPNWATTSGPPKKYWIRHDVTDALVTRIGITPVPSASSTGTFTVHYYSRPTDMTDNLVETCPSTTSRI